MEMGDLRGIGTLLCLLAFLGIAWWAYSPQRRKYFESASRIPFSDSDMDSDMDPELKSELRSELDLKSGQDKEKTDE